MTQSGDGTTGLMPPAPADGGGDVPMASYAAPNWETQRDELLCPLCDYNLRGLGEPRCPECGYRFVWADLLDPRRRGHPYLFEHHPKRNVWSFWRTAVGGLNPVRFWTSLSPTHPSRPGRMLAYWAAAMAVSLLGALAPFAIVWAQSAYANLRVWAIVPGGLRGPGMVPWDIAPFQNKVDSILEQVSPGYIWWWGVGVAWPWMTYLTLMIFRWSMRRAKVNPIHVRRCVLYSADVMLWAGVAVLGLSALQFLDSPSYPSTRFLDMVAPWGLAAFSLFMIARLAIAYQFYLRFDRPWATVLASQVIVALVVFNALLKWSLGSAW